MGAGFFYERHRAKHDCIAAIELLATPLPKAGVPAMAKLLERARRPNWRIWAENSPFELKDQLKARGYRWNGDGTRNPRAWYIDVDDEAIEGASDKFGLCRGCHRRASRCYQCRSSRHPMDVSIMQKECLSQA